MTLAKVLEVGPEAAKSAPKADFLIYSAVTALSVDGFDSGSRWARDHLADLWLVHPTDASRAGQLAAVLTDKD